MMDNGLKLQFKQKWKQIDIAYYVIGIKSATLLTKCY